ncbi:MAG: hypothetical protein U0354_10430 [Candidatus Sericytochromatia bacterium]
MKKILLAITIFISSCNTSNNTNIIPKSSSEILPSPISSNTQTDLNNVESSSKDEDIYSQDGNYINCGTLEENLKKVSMTCPTNISANKDFVYFTNSTFYLSNAFGVSYEVVPPHNCDKLNDKLSSWQKKLSFIYKIDQNKKLDIFRDNTNKPLYSCSEGHWGTIQTNSLNELFISNKKYSNGFISEIIKDPTTRDENNYDYKVFNNEVYFRYINYNEYNQKYMLKKNIDGKESIILRYLSPYSKYIVYYNNLYILSYDLEKTFNFKIIQFKLNNNLEKEINENNTQIIAELKSIRDKNFINSNVDRYKMEDYIYFMGEHITDFKVNSKGELFFTDVLRNLIWKVIPNENKVVVPHVFAGSSTVGFKDGNGEEASFYYPSSITFDENDNMYVADSGNNAIRKITSDGTVTTFYSNK